MYSFILSLTSTLDDDGWSTPRRRRFTPGKVICISCAGGWVGNKAGLDWCGKSIG
jgi:hypothetical protein